MEPNAQAKIDLESLKFHISEYVEKIAPMILPEDATPNEIEAVKRLLTVYTKYDIYNEKINSLDEKSLSNSFSLEGNLLEAKIIEAMLALERIPPQMNLKNLLKKENVSRYSKSKMKLKPNEIPLNDPKRLIYTYGKRLKGKIRDDKAIESMLEHPQINAAMVIRDVFHNGGSMEDFRIDDDKFREIEEITNGIESSLLYELENVLELQEEKRKYMGCKPVHKPQYHVYRAKEKIKTNELMRSFLEDGKLRACYKKIQKEGYIDIDLLRLSDTILDTLNYDYMSDFLSESDSEKQEIKLQDIFKRVKEVLGEPKPKKLAKTRLFIIDNMPFMIPYLPEHKEIYKEMANVISNERSSKRTKFADENGGKLFGLLALATVPTAIVIDELARNAPDKLRNIAIGVAIGGGTLLLLKQLYDRRRVEEEFLDRVHNNRELRESINNVKTDLSLEEILHAEKAVPITEIPGLISKEIGNLNSQVEDGVDTLNSQAEYGTDSLNSQVENKADNMPKNKNSSGDKVPANKDNRIRHRRMDRYKNVGDIEN